MLSLLNSCCSLFNSYLRIRASASSSQNPELLDARAELESSLQNLTGDLQDLTESVTAAAKDPYRYGLELDEVERRRRLVEDVGREVESMQAELHESAREAQRTAKDKTYDMTNGSTPLPDPGEFDDSGEYAAFEQQRQLEIMQDQDEVLDDVFQTVGNLRQQADTMGRELEEQADMLDEVDEITDRVGTKLQTGLKYIGVFLRKNGGMLVP